MRALTPIEQGKLRLLTKHQVPVTLIEPTETGLKKSIMDATGSIRSFLKSNHIHDFDAQGQGPEHKVLIRALIYQESKLLESTASLYKPKTKKGDPRIWFGRLTKAVHPNDIVAICYHSDCFHVFNLTQMDIHAVIQSPLNNPLKELIFGIGSKANEVAMELLEMLKRIALAGPISSLVDADTSVGRTLETALGIEINSSKKPDYKGIELKAFRSSRSNRKNLFAQVPDWKLSKLKSSSEILDAFGYKRDADFKLYCTVSAITRNSQGLALRLDSDIKHLIENSDQAAYGDYAVWQLATLHKRLLEKHRETFWVEAETMKLDGKEHFQYSVVEHTKKPIVSQFDLLIEQGIITLDHLIKRNAKGKVVEKGPLFKIKPTGLDLLFPPSQKYSLR